MGSGNRYEAYEDDLWERLARLLPSAEDTENFRDCRESGHQEAGLWILMQRLLEHQIPINDRTRAEIEILAEQWGERLARHDQIAACVRDSTDYGSIRLLPDDRATPVHPSQIGITDAALTGLLVVPWLECLRCGRVLARVHAQEPWGDLSYLATHYIVWHRTASDGSLETFDEPDLHSAFELLMNCA
ncbi:hypothetical protein AB0H76_33985 [Nocardia sp. NPDC050712]|uniref:hypothetical protein n=1 Tax=Nocardia sp. NPDC050712 TaxID=3155518 RepID=UPI0033F752CE